MNTPDPSPLALAAGPSEQIPTCKSDLHVAECPNCEHSFDEHGNAIGCLLGDCDCAYTKRKLFDLARGALPELLRAQTENAKLKLLAGKALLAVRDQEIGDWDGGAVQDAMVACGLLDEVRATERCGEGCRCAEWDDFPQTCYRISALGNACLDDAWDKPAAAVSSSGSVEHG